MTTTEHIDDILARRRGVPLAELPTWYFIDAEGRVIDDSITREQTELKHYPSELVAELLELLGAQISSNDDDLSAEEIGLSLAATAADLRPGGALFEAWHGSELSEADLQLLATRPTKDAGDE